VTRIATCRCGAPLVCTFHWRGHEFYCLDCGSLYDFLSPIGVEETPETLARMRAYLAEWDEHAGARLVTPRSWREDCPRCRDPETGQMLECHDQHATEEEWSAHREATAWLEQRVKAAV
jgi:hypothetical protein